MNRILPLFLLPFAAYPNTIITLGSSALTTQNNASGSATVNIAPNPAWAAALAGTSWVSIANTGDPGSPNFVVIPNGTSVTFFQQFFLDGTPDSARLSVLADDTTSVFVNGNPVAAQYTIAGIHCAAQPIGCLAATRGDFGSAVLLPLLNPGTNTIQFDVLQHDMASFGLDYSGTIVTNPEPGTLGLVAVAGLLICLTRMKRRGPTDGPSL